MRTIALATLFTALSLTQAPAARALECGDTISAGETVVLDGNVGPCTQETGGIWIEGPATLDLNGFSITCEITTGPSPVGIRVEGHRARVQNGHVLGCRRGVVLLGEGGHRVSHMTAAYSQEGGFSVGAKRNIVKRCESLFNQGRGFTVYGRRQTIKRNLAADNGDHGFVVSGQRHLLSRNASLDNERVGIYVGGNSLEKHNNVFKRNVSLGHTEPDIFATDQDCGENNWRLNTFDFASPACVR